MGFFVTLDASDRERGGRRWDEQGDEEEVRACHRGFYAISGGHRRIVKGREWMTTIHTHFYHFRYRKCG